VETVPRNATLEITRMETIRKEKETMVGRRKGMENRNKNKSTRRGGKRAYGVLQIVTLLGLGKVVEGVAQRLEGGLGYTIVLKRSLLQRLNFGARGRRQLAEQLLVEGVVHSAAHSNALEGAVGDDTKKTNGTNGSSTSNSSDEAVLDGIEDYLDESHFARRRCEAVDS